MSTISINLGDTIDQHDIKVLRESLKNMKSGEEIIIRMKAMVAHESGRVTDELARQGFDYQPHGGSGTDFYFTALKK